jgi:hypothetical protein
MQSLDYRSLTPRHISKEEQEMITLTHIYINAYFLNMTQALQEIVAGLH